MGKMKEKFLEDQEKAINDALDVFYDDDYQLEEYYSSLQPEKSKPVTMEETIKNHDEWWNSLSEEEKQKIAVEHQEAENAYNEWKADGDINIAKDQSDYENR